VQRKATSATSPTVSRDGLARWLYRGATLRRPQDCADAK
jgi:hypothetical protein